MADTSNNSITSKLRSAWDWAVGLPGRLYDDAKNLVHGTKQKITQTYNNAVAAVSDETQAIEDKAADTAHPVYSSIEWGLQKIFGEANMRGFAEMLLGFFDKGNGQGFGSGEFSEALQRWDRELSRDLGQKPLAPKGTAAPAPAN
jgi:hypothetical protein